mgnify:CR=1 FL=1
MPRQIRIEYPGAHYHVFARGERKDNIFFHNEDYLKFLEKLKENLEKYNVNCLAYALMPNHYHLYLITNEANISKFMQSLNSSYTNWIKAKRDIVGHLFQGRYKAILVDKEEYSDVVIDYIHFNPVKAGFKKLPWQYKWSSCKYYTDKTQDLSFLNIEFILSKYSDNLNISKDKYKQNLVNKENYDLPHRNLFKGIALAGEKYKKEINKLITNQKEDIDLPSTKMNKKRGAEFYISLIKNHFNISEKDIFNKKYNNKFRKYFTYLTKKYSRLTNIEIAVYLKIRPESVSNLYTRIKEEIEGKKEYKADMRKIKCEITRSDP